MDGLTALALTGLARVSEANASIATGAPVDGLIARLPGIEPERQLLLAAGAQAIYRQAGHTPRSGVAATDPAPTEELALCPTSAAPAIAAMFAGQHAELLPEALALLRRRGLRLPPELLPAALDTGARVVDLRPALLPVLGARGRWLSRFKQEWHWPEDDEIPPALDVIWEEGTPSRRLALLRHLRATDPARGLELLAESWKREKADFRAKAVAVLAEGLSLADEPFLEAALDDRSQGVRAEAATQLARLPGSALLARMRDRADAMLDYRPATPAPRSGLRALFKSTAGDSAKLLVTPPDTLDPGWQRDGLPPLADGAGKRVRWLMHTLACVPPEHWEARFGATPQAVIASAAPSEWTLTLLVGWTMAAVKFRSASWALPLFQWWLALEPKDAQAAGFNPQLIRPLAAMMPPGELQRTAERLLDDVAKSEQPRVNELLWSLPQPWSAELGERYLQAMRRRLHPRQASGNNLDPWTSTLPLAGLSLPPECFAAALVAGEPPKTIDGWVMQEWRRALLQFQETIQIRQRLWQALEESE